MVTDLAEVFRLGTSKAKENLAFRRYVAARHVSDRHFQILASEVQREMDCTACANCCRHGVVPVSEAEIEEIAQLLGVTPQTVVHQYTAPDPDVAGARILLNLREGCVFLDGNNCMVYDARPKTCRDFPHVAIGTHSLGGRPASLARWAALCPIIYTALERHKHMVGFRAHRGVPSESA